MSPDVASLGVNTKYGCKTLSEAWEWRTVTFLEEIIVLEQDDSNAALKKDDEHLLVETEEDLRNQQLSTTETCATHSWQTPELIN